MIRTIIKFICILTALAQTPPAIADIPLRFSFESGDLDGWTIVEGSFGDIISAREHFHGIDEPYNKDGVYFLSTLERDDGAPFDGFTGVIESPVFILNDPALTFYVGGGKHGDTYVALCTLDGGEKFRASGTNNERMQRIEWRAPDLVGKRLFLRIVDENTGGWGHVTFDGFTAGGSIDDEATKERFADLDRLNRARRIRFELDTVDFPTLKAAITDLAGTFSDDYPRGQEFLDRLDALETGMIGLETSLENSGSAGLGELERAIRRFGDLKREALTANPLIARYPLIFIVREQYLPDHHNSATIFQTGEVNTASFRGGGAMKALDPATGDVRTLVETADGIVRDPDVHFDSGKILFSMRRNIRDDYHIYEIGSDGTGLCQLTSAEGVADIDPLYLPDGCIAFSSTREPKYCMCNKHIMANLFRM